jgi:hypothetical protein
MPFAGSLSRFFLRGNWVGGTQLSVHHPGSLHCFRTVPSVAQCRVMPYEEASGVNFPAINSQADQVEEAHGVGEAEQDILVYQAPNEGTFLLRRYWFKVI